MNHKTLTTTLIIAFSITAAAQRTMVVTDAETGVPIRDVQIFVNGDDNNRIVTDYKGEFIVPDTAGNLTLCHRKYEKTTDGRQRICRYHQSAAPTTTV